MVCMLQPSQGHSHNRGLIATALQSKRKGLSVDEKRDKILEIFHETADVYVLKVGGYCCPQQGRRGTAHVSNRKQHHFTVQPLSDHVM
jgi:hypothetical protein